MPLAHITNLYQHVLAADHAYIDDPTWETNLEVCRAQQPYYSALVRHHKATNTPDQARRERVRALYARACQNAKRLPDYPDWQQLAHHQIRRAMLVRIHIYALTEEQPKQHKLPYKPKPKHPPKPKRTQKRIVHPITGRYVYIATDTDQD